MTAYYNEHDRFAAAWLRELIADGLIAPGEVDERSIEDVTPNDLRPFRQCHFFAGIGVWSLAARRAGISDDTPLWTGSCPCQPFSAAGKGGGFDDERHLWPAFHYLIEQCGPAIVAGEQVAGADGDTWLDLVSADLDATGYAFGAAETCAAGFGAPHIRSRNYWVAVSDRARLQGSAAGGATRQGREGAAAQRDGAALRLDDAAGVGPERRDAVARSGAGREYAGASAVDELAAADGVGSDRRRAAAGYEARPGAGDARDGAVDRLADTIGDGHGQHGRRLGGPAGASEGGPGERERVRHDPADGGAVSGLADNHDDGRQPGGLSVRQGQSGSAAAIAVRPSEIMRPGPVNGLWRDADWLFCRDDPVPKWRPVESGTFPLVNAGAFRNRVGILRGAGNAVTLAQAEEFLIAVRRSLPGLLG